MVNQVSHRVNISFSTEGTESEDGDTASNATPEISQSCFQDLLPKHQTDKTGTSLSKIFITSFKAVARMKGTKKNDSKPIGQFLREMAGETLTRFSLKQIKSFTTNFHSKIGMGGFGTIYKGLMPTGVYVAVKMLRNYGDEEFMAEVRILGRAYHRNLVRLIGYCVQGDVRALVYEYVPNGTLEKFLVSNRNGINWEMLQTIAIGTAKVISYLHEECPEVIVHLDVKPSNILLDAKFSPKLADFGFAHKYDSDNKDGIIASIRGTHGYIDPNFLLYGCATCKCDIYSFGMVLFDILGRYRLEGSDHSDHRLFAEQVWEKFTTGNLEYLKEEEGRMSLAALWCIQDRPEDRPSMSTVVNILKGDIEVMQPPYPFSSFSKSYSYTNTASASFSSRSGEITEINSVQSGPDYGG